jgi:soluble lytic murein transglycosylase
MQRLPLCALIFLISASAGCSSDNGATRATPAAPATPATTAPGHDTEPGQPAKVALTTEMARPYFTDGPLAEAALRFRLEDWRAARDGFGAHLAADDAPVDGPDRARVLLLASIADTHLGEWRPAAEGFEYAAENLPVLRDYILYQAARARYFARDMDAALAHARAVAGDSVSGADAALLVGDILRGRGEWDEVAAHYRAYLDERPRGIRLAEARFRLAEALEKQGRAVPDAIDLYRRITIADPLAAWAERAQARLDELLPALPAAERARYTQLSADEYIERGMVYFGAMRNLPAESTFEAAMTAPGITDETRCVAAFHRATSWFRERNRPRSAPLYDEAVKLCEKAGNDDLRVKAAYNAGRSYMMIGKPEVAIERYAIIEDDHADHSYADDARLRRAEAARRMGDEDLVTEFLSTIPERYPDGDMRAEAMWRLAWRAIKDRKWDEAVTWLERQIEVVPLDDNYWAEGQAQYWLGRSYAALGKTAESIASYEQAVRLYPLSYYSLLALNRLRERHPKRFAALVEEIKTPPADYDPAQPPFQFRPRAVYAAPGFERALELLRLGLGNPAEAELRRLGLTAPAGKSRVDDPDEIETIWAMAYLHHLGGRSGTTASAGRSASRRPTASSSRATPRSTATPPT